MNTAIPVKPSGLQEVTTTEALHGSLANRRPLEGEGKKRVERFIAAHTQSGQTGNDASVHPQGLAGSSSEPQVNASEQQHAALQRGLAEADPKKKGRGSKYADIYKTLFTGSDSFHHKDQMSMLHSVRSKGKSLVDLAGDLNPAEKALRKFLLLKSLEQDHGGLLSAGDRTELLLVRKKLESEFGDFIQGTVGAYDIGKAKAFKGPSLCEFIKAYQIIEIQPNTISVPDLHALYKLIKKDLEAGAPRSKLIAMQEGFVQILSREKTQEPSRVTSPRHHIILSRIKQFGLLINLHALHGKFLDWGRTANLQGLPSMAQLTESCLQAVLTNETLAGANALIAIASAVRSDKLPARNAFITNYCRWVLLHDLLIGMYKNSNQRKILVENIERNTQLSAILSPSS